MGWTPPTHRLAQAESLYASTDLGEPIVIWLANKLASSRENLCVRLQTIQLQETLMHANLIWVKKIRRKHRHVLQSIARKLEKQLLIAVERVNSNYLISDWHALRLNVKRLRYWTEGFDHLLTKPQRSRLSVLVKLQQRLGLLHDISLFDGLFLQEHKLPNSWTIKLKQQQKKILAQTESLLRNLKNS
jgi:Uncharacterized conserved protein